MTKPARVAIVGNMNNNANNVIRYLIDRGIDATLLFFEHEAGHFTPEADNIDAVRYPHATLDWGGYASLYRTSRATILRSVADFDFIIGSRLAPAYLAKAGRPLDLFMPTGGDVWTVPVFVDWQPRNAIKYLFFSRQQREGIRQSGAIFLDQLNNDTERTIAPVVDGMRRLHHPIPCIYCPDYEGDRLDARMAASEYLPLFRQLRADNDILLVHHVKHLWKPDSVRKFDILQEKGNDRIFHGLKAVKQRHPHVRLKLLTIAYGSDHEASRQLAVELGVDDMVHWFKHVPRKELMIAIHLADAVIGELARSWLTYGTVMEAMAMNKPIIHNRDDAYYAGRVLYPMLHAHDADSVGRALDFLVEQPEAARAMGAAGGRWYRDIAVGRGIADICTLIEEKAQRIRAAG